jgi:glycosyltransferase involved in cell wall biosynthesis
MSESTTTPSLSIVIPVYNEELGIEGVISSLLDNLSFLEGEGSVEIIIVNDGSSDRTGEILKGIIDPRIMFVEHPFNRGYGAALKTGIRNSSAPWVLITDADGTYPNDAISELWKERADNDMVVGSRTGPIRSSPLIRRPPKWVLRKLASYLSRTDIPDLNSGLRLMRREIVGQFKNILPTGFSFTTTITLAMLSAGYRVKYVPVDYLKRHGKSKIRPIYDTINFLQLIIRTIMFFDPLRIFLPLSFAFIGGSVFVGVGSYFYLERFLDSTTVMLFVTGVQLLALGMLADMINRRLNS